MISQHEEAKMMAEFHSRWLLFMHCSFHVQTFSRELERFYDVDSGFINMTSVGLQWASLFFAILCGSMASAQPSNVTEWGFRQGMDAVVLCNQSVLIRWTTGDQGMLARQWFQASIECLNVARHQQNHNRKFADQSAQNALVSTVKIVYSIQTVSTLTICAHVLGFSNSYSCLLAAAVKIAHSLGTHRLSGSKKEADNESITDSLRKELGCRLWLQLVMQDWFPVPFSGTNCKSPGRVLPSTMLHWADYV